MNGQTFTKRQRNMNNITTNTATGLQSRTAYVPSITKSIEKLNDAIFSVSETVNDLLNHFIPEATKIIEQLKKCQDEYDVKKLKSLVMYLPDGKQRDQIIAVLNDLKFNMEFK